MSIDINDMYYEMQTTMANNFTGTQVERFEQAKALFLEDVADSIEQNRILLTGEAV